MEYESRKIKWYYLLLFVLFCAGVVYLLFSGNPYLYSHLELRSALVAGEVKYRRTIPSKPDAPAKLGPPSAWARYNLQRTAVDPVSAPRSRSYVEFEKHAVELGEGFDVQHVNGDQSGFVVTGKSPRAAAVDLDGRVRWTYAFSEAVGDRGLWPAQIDEQSVYLIHPTGEVVCLDKVTGALRWLLPLHQEVAAAPFLWGKELMVPIKGPSGVQMTAIARGDGRVEGPPVKLDAKPGFTVSESVSLTALILTIDNKVSAVDPETWKTLWSQTLTEPTRGPAVVVDNQIFVATMGGKIVRLDGAKRGKIDWEVELEKPAVSAPSYLPVMHRLAFLDTAGQLTAIDAKLGKVLWRTPVENRNVLNETWSARLKGQNIEEFKMDWLHKGWTIWTPCRDRGFCVYTPNKGQLIERIALTGVPLALPIALDKRWAFFTQVKPGRFNVSKILEESEVKKLHAQSEKTH